MNKHYIEPLSNCFYYRIFIKWNMVFLPHICISKIEEYKEGIDVFALAYRNHTDDHYMAADG